MQDENYDEWREHTESRFREMSPVCETPEIHPSLSGEFSLEITQYTSGPESWNYSRGIVKNLVSGEVIADIKRNLAGFWFSWIFRADGEYLLCGEDYQGYNVIDLRKGKNVLTFPPEAYKGQGFCWGSALPSPSGRVLAVNGCFWGAPNDLVFYDFSEPLRSPLPELYRVEEILEEIGWVSESEFEYTHEHGDETHHSILKLEFASEV